MIAGIEIGGTKTVVGVRQNVTSELTEYKLIPTEGPEETLSNCVSWLNEQSASKRATIRAIGIASFGPIRLDAHAKDFGSLLATPKFGWAGYSVLNRIKQAFPYVPVVIDTDVNAAALAEAEGASDVVYITVGTGIGAGVLSGGRLVHGTLHPEVGHLRIPRIAEDHFPGCCPFHGDCLEGLASGPALEARWHMPAHSLPHHHIAWAWEAYYLALGVLALVAILSPKQVIIGGGVSQAYGLHDRINENLTKLSGGYFAMSIEHPFVRPPSRGQIAGLEGALMLALKGLG